MKTIFIGALIFTVFLGMAVLAFGDMSRNAAGGDPFVADANGRATSEAARARIEATKAAVKAAEMDQANQVLYMTAVAADSQATAAAVAAIFQATATASFQGTASALSLESTAIAINAESTAVAANLAATAVARDFEAERRALEIERARRSNTVRAFFVYAIVAAFSLGTLFAVVYVVVSLAKTRIIERDKFILRGNRLIDPSLAHTTVIDIDDPAISSDHVKIKERAQIADVVRLLPGRASRPEFSPDAIERLFGAGVSSETSPSIKIQKVEIIDPSAISPWIDEVETKLLDEPD